jgi:hypothetical protein
MESETKTTIDAITASEQESSSAGRITRREALEILGKHAVYTAPAVLGILSVVKSGQAVADVSG